MYLAERGSTSLTVIKAKGVEGKEERVDARGSREIAAVKVDWVVPRAEYVARFPRMAMLSRVGTRVYDRSSPNDRESH